MRSLVCALAAAMGIAAHPALAQNDRTAPAFWKAVQASCDATADKLPSGLGRRIAQTAIDEFERFGGHRIDSNGRLFRFGLTEAEHGTSDGGEPSVGQLGWWQVLKYWRAVFGDDIAGKLEVRGYQDASTVTEQSKAAPLLRTDAARLLRLADGVSDPAAREILREAAYRAAIVDTSWSAAFVSYVVREAGVAPGAFRFANAHRVYIYEAFAVSAAEAAGRSREGAYRACPLVTRPRLGDLICQHRESALVNVSDRDVREQIRGELAGGADARTVRRTHCEVVAHIDVSASKVYTVGGNVNQAVSARKLNLRQHDLRFSTAQKGHCGGAGHWTLPHPGADAPDSGTKCSLNDRKWFVLLQLR